MQPIKLCIEGDFWDCQIYRGRLYVWEMNGSMAVYNWDEIVNSLKCQVEDDLPIDCAFTRGNFLYGHQLRELFNYKTFKLYLEERFREYADKRFLIENSQLKNFEIIRLDNPFKELPTDTEIYKNNLYAVTDLGLSKITIHGSRNNYVGKRLTKLSDCPFISLKASKRTLALSGGNEGLFEFHIKSQQVQDAFTEVEKDSRLEKIENNLFRISLQHSSFVNWSFASLYSSSYVSQSFMAAFGWKQEEKNNDVIYKREFNRIFSQSQIFSGSADLSWGLQEKIYKTNTKSRSIDVIQYVQNHTNKNMDDDFSSAFTSLNSIQFEDWAGDIIGGGTSYFGVIIELENAISILTSNDDLFTIPQAVVRWRVYPRSKNYENHLHIISDKCLEIYSFNHDYFVFQDDKKAGIKYS
jgi:hypothetical protein